MKTLVLIECEGGALAGGALCAARAAQALGPIVILACGEGAEQAAAGLARLPAVERVVVAADGDGAHPPRAERYAPWVVAQCERLGCTHVTASAGAFARAVLPRIAALLDVMAFSDVVEVLDESTFVRPVHAGSALMTVQSQDRVRVFSVRTSSFEPAQPQEGAQPAPIENAELAASTQRQSERVERTRPRQGEGVELIGARVVVSGGRGVGSAEGFERLRPLADQLGAAVGASRAAVDAGYAAADSQVGQTGKSVAPELYIALGISGAVQHWAGMKDSKVIVAVNKDPEAPIFQFADYGIVGDLFEMVPALERELAASGQA